MSEFQIYMSVAVFAAVILAIAFDVIDMAVATLLGVSVLIGFDVLREDDIIAAVKTAGGPLSLLFGGMVVARTLASTGLFDRVGAAYLRATRGSGKRFLLLLIALVAPLCAFLPNATTVILLAPVIVRVTVALEVDFVGPLILTAIVSNSAGLLTLVGDPATFLVGSSIGMSFGEYLRIHSGPLGLLVGDAVGRVAGSLSLARLAWNRSRSAFRAARWNTVWNAAVRYRHFPFLSSGSSLLGVAAYSLPPLLMAQLYGPKTLGWFALGDRVLGAPAVLIGQAVSQVYCVEAAALNTADPNALLGLFMRSVKRLLLLGFIPFLTFLFFGPILFGFIFGQSWREAGVYARWLAAMHYVAFVSWPLTPTLNILEKQSWQLGWEIGRLLLVMGSLWLTHHWGWSARSAIGTFGAAIFVGYASHLLLSHYGIKKRIRQFETDKQSRSIASPEYVESGMF